MSSNKILFEDELTTSKWWYNEVDEYVKNAFHAT